MGRPSKLPAILALLGAAVAVVAICFATGEEDKLDNDILIEPERKAEGGKDGSGLPGVALPFSLVNGEARFGLPEAQVQVIAFIPSAGNGGCGNETGSVLHSLQSANPDRLFVHVLDFDSQAGQAMQATLGTSCAGILINEKQEIEVVKADGKVITVSFKSNLGDSYSEEELVAALDMEFDNAYGEPMIVPAPDGTPDVIPDATDDAPADPRGGPAEARDDEPSEEAAPTA